MLESGDSLAVEYVVDASDMAQGTAQGTISFAVLDERRTYRGCTGRDASFDVLVRVSPSPEYNHLGWIRAIGVTLMSMVILTAAALATWVLIHRAERIVTTLQPSFLVAVSLGVLIMSTAIVPLSVDDSDFSVRGCNVACMATPWALGMGLTISFSALGSKLWRINKLLGRSGPLRRIRVDQRVFFETLSVMFVLNFSFLLTWTLVDPLRWTRLPVEGDEPWNTYGTCRGTGPVSKAMMSLVVAVNVLALVLACFEAWKARHISDEFSEGRYLGVALYSWLQLTMVGLPIMFLIDDGNPAAKYFLHVVLLFAFCMSMLLLIFAPILKKLCSRGEEGQDRGNVHISGINTTAPTKSSLRLTNESIKSANSNEVKLGSIRVTWEKDRDKVASGGESMTLEDSQQLDKSFSDNPHNCSMTFPAASV